jgi:hypothetical protein
MNYNLITLNGASPDDFEDLGLNRKRHHQCCKTAYCHSDTLACAILSIANEYYPALSVSSDAVMGPKPDTWPGAFAWPSKVLGRDVPLPWNRPTVVNPIELAVGLTLGPGTGVWFADLTEKRRSGLGGLWRSALRRIRFG